MGASPDPLIVACVLRSGGCYTAEYVERLQAGVSEHLDDHRFVCLTDLPSVPCERIALQQNWPGWWAKLEVFRLVGRVLYFDLDTVIKGSLADIAGWPHRFTMLSDFFRPEQPASGVMAWRGDWSRLYRDYQPGAQYPGHGDQGYIAAALGFNPARFQALLPGQIVSRKVPSARNSNERVVCFHGEPRPHQVNWRI